MDAEIAAHAMACAVVVVDPRLPQSGARQRIELAAAGAGWEARGRNGDMAL